MSEEKHRKIDIEYDESLKQDSPVPEASSHDSLGGAITEIQLYLRKYSTTSSVFAEQSISNPDYQRTLYCISCILQAELFDDLGDASGSVLQNPELVIHTTLPPHLGGPVDVVPEEILERECRDDPELRTEILAGTVPTVDTILRFISWVHQSAKYSTQCNIIAFIYVKRMMDAKVVLSMDNWRGMWLGAVVLAQKVWDDASLRTSSFACILPGVTKSQLKALELKVFTLLNYCTSVKPSVYARFYFELREIFKNITGEFRDATVLPERAPRRRPLTMKKGKFLSQSAVDVVTASSRNSKAASPRSKASTTSTTASGAAPLPAVTAPSPSSLAQRNQQDQRQHQQPQQGASAGAGVKLPLISKSGLSPSAAPVLGAGAGSGAASTRALDDGAGTQSSAAHQHQQFDQFDQQTRNRHSSAASTPGRHRGAGLAGNARPKSMPATLEDHDYVSSSFYVLS